MLTTGSFQKIFMLWMVLSSLKAQSIYYPPKGDWEEKTPGAMGVDSNLLAKAIEFAQENENPASRDLEINHYLSFGKEPFGDAIGPHKTRGPATGLIVKNGYIIGKWGDPWRVDMTFSVTKSFLSSTVGIAYDQGLIPDLDQPVFSSMAPVVVIDPDPSGDRANQLGQPKVYEPFTGTHNKTITWNHLLRQTSDWEGTLWGKPDWADRPSDDPSQWLTRKRNPAGSFFEYNDVRVNLLALACMNVMREPLPVVLRRALMDPIGASPTWRWLGYENSWVLIDGQAMQAVSGGGHWGGGMLINAYDQARFGYLTLQRGRWQNKVILSDDWVKMALTPTAANQTYGFMNWFLNTERKLLPSAPEHSFFHLGAGTNMIYVDPTNQLLIVARWINRDALNGLVERVLQAL